MPAHHPLCLIPITSIKQEVRRDMADVASWCMSAKEPWVDDLAHRDL